MVDAQDHGPTSQRFHHGGEDGRALSAMNRKSTDAADGNLAAHYPKPRMNSPVMGAACSPDSITRTAGSAAAFPTAFASERA